MPVATVRRRPPIEYSILHDARPSGPSIGTYADHEFPELVVDGYGRQFEYAGVTSRRIDGQFDDDALKPGEMIVRSGKRDSPCLLVLVCNSIQLHPDAGGAGAISARLELEHDGDFAQVLERIRPEGHSRATGPHPQQRPVPCSRGAGSGSWNTSSTKLWPGAASGSRAITSPWRSSIVPRRSTPSSTPSCASRRRACARSFASTMTTDGQSDPIRIELPQGQLHAAHRVSAGGNT